MLVSCEFSAYLRDIPADDVCLLKRVSPSINSGAIRDDVVDCSLGVLVVSPLIISVLQV